jgi:oligopeptide/dipeptide ABC transporter ATP-binding protein
MNNCSVDNLSIEFATDKGTIRAVDGVSFDIPKGKTVGLVGESGCGKSVTALSVMRLIPTPPGHFAGGQIRYEDQDLLKLPESRMRELRGNRISMIFQEPMTSLNPVFTIGNQIAEAICLHEKLNYKASLEKAIHMLELVGIPSPRDRAACYPHQLSGGMRQRVMIAMALACKPDLLIADEPTTALDVTIQAQIMELMLKLQQEMGMSILLITHDLGVVAETCNEVVVMYAGRVVEKADVQTIFKHPKHPYTVGLLASVPGTHHEGSRLQTIPGLVPNLLNLPKGCRFQDRCPRVTDICRQVEPELTSIDSHAFRCYNPY